MLANKSLASMTGFYLFLTLHACLSFAMCDKNSSKNPQLYNVKEELFIKEDFSEHQIFIKGEIYKSGKLKNFLLPKFTYHFHHGPHIEYGLSVRRHVLRLKFLITE